ncbi:efflux RND transporter periplasmic adaptor subunit [Botrimarina mediterranea]|uniref:Multidrug resistance protein MdtA n=1 Tax=Botrimarina mediterranea TaxID=2528022 RepID=A0A518KA67_9BACT|nr:Multidrug resistance protein MdtA precursor [Botrimarina mediterranea]QDV79318.1 Multidrug resistance protein MdtA precursor [Planctomycetes bacterium K2D]
MRHYQLMTAAPQPIAKSSAPTAAQRAAGPLGIALRSALPIAILALGWYGFTTLAVEIEQKPAQAPAALTLRTKVENLVVEDYPVIIKTNAVVQSVNRVVLSAEVAGTIVKVSPSFEVGAYFKAGDVLVEIDRRDYETALSIAESELAAAKSALKLATLVEERKLRLVESNAVSRAEVYEASATREQAEADVELAKTRLAQASLNLQRTRVVAPFDGRVQAKQIGLGQLANPSSPLGEVFAVEFAEVRLPISSEQRQYLELPEFADDPPLRVELRDAINSENDTAWEAEIVRTEGVLDESSRDLFAIARIDDPFGRESGRPAIRIGQPVLASIEGRVLRDVIALPRGAVRELDKVVLVNQSDQTLLPLSVSAIWSDADHVVVASSSLPHNTWIATTPMAFTPKGAKVDIIPDAQSGTAIADAKTEDADSGVAN